MTQAELMAIGRLEGRVDALEKRSERVEDKIDRILDSMNEDRQSVADMRIEDLQQELKYRRSIRPKPKSSGIVKAMLPWVLGALVALGSALATWLGTG